MAAGRGAVMKTEPIFAACSMVMLLIMAALEGGGLSAGQAFILALPITPILAWSFVSSNLYEPTKGGDKNENCI